MTRIKKFQPHDYATFLIQSKNFCSDRSLLYRWTDTHWQVVVDDEATSCCYHWLVKNQLDHISPKNAIEAVRAALMFLPALPDIGCNNLNALVIPCQNGYVHLPNDGSAPVLMRPNPELGIRHVLTVDYDPLIKIAPTFEKFLARALPNQAVRDRVQEYIGYTLLPDTRFQRAQIWLGDGANGKGVLAKIVQKLHGAVAAARLNELGGFSLANLIGASLVICDEVPRGRIDEQILKTLVSGDKVNVPRKYLSSANLFLPGKWLVLGNHIPDINDHS